ncbi:hypothetical protein PI87_04810 [Ralstonia sp. A12]|uniref:hypothetical protein n=1 Tax=Ralstonia sp. A12 TaxID=1217052 RepID=UPI0005754BC2|nr:hypothetical protein [Ralstonia sp. A12]KHK57767.1 hypothetical protein PI87_04810 [Ralstonia sp. A12]
MLLMASLLFVVGFVAGMSGAPPSVSSTFPQMGRVPRSLALGVLISGAISFLVCWVSVLFNFLEVIASKRSDANQEEAKSYFGYYVLSARYLSEEGVAARARLFFFFVASLVFCGFTVAVFSCIGRVFGLS